MSQPGTFVWNDLMATDVDGATAFYGALFPEWDIVGQPMGEFTYHMIHAGERPLGGFVPLDPALGVPAHWIGYVRVEDCDAAVARAVDAGGAVDVPPFDAPGVGRLALVADPQGARLHVFAVAQPYERPSGEGAVAWCELMTTDVGAASTFYRQLFGWTARATSAGGMDYTLFDSAGSEVAGAIDLVQAGLESPPAWGYYFGTKELDRRSARVVELGGAVYQGPESVPGQGRFAVCADPSGAVFSLWETAEVEA